MRWTGWVRTGLVVAVLGSMTTGVGQALAADSAGQSPRVIVLEKDGPVPIPVDQMGPIATMQLPPGRWAILAKLNPVATGFSGNFVRCRLDAGADADRTEHTVYDSSTTESRIVFGLQVAHVFSGPEGGAARLRCASSGPEVEARFIRTTAIQAGRLTRIELPTRTRTTNGHGPPKVVFAWRNEPVSVRADELGTVGRIHLPHGSWAVFAKLDLARSSGTTSDVVCRLSAGRDFDRIALAVANAPPPPDRPIPLLNVAHRFESASGGPAALRCRRSGAPLKASFVRITAIRSGDLTDRAIAGTEGSGNPDIVYGHRDAPVPIPASNEYSTVASLRLSRGSWLVLAKADVGRDIGTGEDFVDCRLVAGDDRDEVNIYTNDREGIAFHLLHTFTSDTGGTVNLRCRSLQGGDDIRLVRFTAMRAGGSSLF